MVHSAASRERCLQRLFKLDVRDAEASFPADKEGLRHLALAVRLRHLQDLILNKIENVDVFNHQLQATWLARLWWFVSDDTMNPGFAIAPLGHISGGQPFQSSCKLPGRDRPSHFDRGLLSNIFRSLFVK